MTALAILNGNGSATHICTEGFRTYADAELKASPPWVRGICFSPECGVAFKPNRDWQIHCSPACKKAWEIEMRKWGNRLAFSALVWRMGKYEQNDTGVRDLSRAARRHVTQVQSAWLADRNARRSVG